MQTLAGSGSSTWLSAISAFPNVSEGKVGWSQCREMRLTDDRFRKPVSMMWRRYNWAGFGNVRHRLSPALRLFDLVEIGIEGGHENVLVASARSEPRAIRYQSLIPFEIEPHG